MNSSFQLPLLDAPAAVCRHRGLVSRLLDKAQARGRLVVSVDELVASSKLTPLAVKRQLEHVAERVTRLSGRPSSYLIVPPEHRAGGAPPMDSWLGDYFRLREQPYYLGLLSAAAMHGSSQQAVQVTQVMTLLPVRPMQVGRLRIEFHVKASLERTPLTELGGLAAPLAVSSPEATALDLVAFNQSIGGTERAAEVILGLLPTMSAAGLRQALVAESKVTVKQRLGYIFEILGATKLASVVEASLPARTMRILLQLAAPSTSASVIAPWGVVDNIELKAKLS